VENFSNPSDQTSSLKEEANYSVSDIFGEDDDTPSEEEINMIIAADTKIERDLDHYIPTNLCSGNPSLSKGAISRQAVCLV
jgi:hypothetical protein